MDAEELMTKDELTHNEMTLLRALVLYQDKDLREECQLCKKAGLDPAKILRGHRREKAKVRI